MYFIETEYISTPVVVVMFTEREFNASEGAGMMSIGVELNRETAQNITLQLIIIPITAEGNKIIIVW